MRQNGVMHFPRQPQHAPPRSPIHGPALPIGLAVTAIGILIAIATAPASGVSSDQAMPEPSVVQAVPGIELDATAATDPCTDQTVIDAIAAADDSAIIAGSGGGERSLDGAGGPLACLGGREQGAITHPDRFRAAAAVAGATADDNGLGA